MKTIGIIGGLAWPSSATYYQIINKLVSTRLGGLHCAKLIIIQTDFDDINRWELSGEWDKVGETMVALADKLKTAGADFFLIACNTVHKSLPPLQDQITLPFIHIVDASAQRTVAAGFKKVGLLGSHFTMTDDYFVGRLTRQYGLDVLVPAESHQKVIQAALIGELARGLFLDSTRSKFRDVISSLIERGAEVIILGCTEFGRLVLSEDSSVPIIDTLVAHAEAAVDMALTDSESP